MKYIGTGYKYIFPEYIGNISGLAPLHWDINFKGFQQICFVTQYHFSIFALQITVLSFLVWLPDGELFGVFFVKFVLSSWKSMNQNTFLIILNIDMYCIYQLKVNWHIKTNCTYSLNEKRMNIYHLQNPEPYQKI